MGTVLILAGVAWTGVWIAGQLTKRRLRAYEERQRKEAGK